MLLWEINWNADLQRLWLCFATQFDDIHGRSIGSIWSWGFESLSNCLNSSTTNWPWWWLSWFCTAKLLAFTGDFNFTAPIAETDLFRTRLADWCGPIAYAHCNTCKVALFMRDMLTWRDFRQTLISQVSCTDQRFGTGRRSCETCWTEPNRISRQSLTADMHHLLTFHFRRTMARKGKIRRGLSD